MIGIVGALLSAFGFGSANVVIKKSLSSLSILQTLLMSTLSGIFFLVLLSMVNGVFEDPTSKMLTMALGMAFFEVVLYIVLYKAFETSNVSVATAVISSYPILATLVSVIFFSEKIAANKFFFIILMVVGAIVTSVRWEDVRKDGFDKKDLIKGLPWIIAAFIVHAFYYPLLGDFSVEGNWETRLLFIKMFSAVILFIGALLLRQKKVFPPKNMLLFTSLLGFFEILGWAGFSWASSDSKGETAIIIAIVSSLALVTAIEAYIFLKEKLTPLQYLGILIIVISLTGLSL